MMSCNIGRYDRIARVVLGLILGCSALLLVEHPVIRVVVGLFALFCFWEGGRGVCPLVAKQGVNSTKQAVSLESIYLFGLSGIQVVLGYIWASGGWGKIFQGTFAAGLEKTLTLFVSKNPYPWYQSFLTDFVIPRAAFFGQLVQWGEFIAGCALLLGIVFQLFCQQAFVRRLGNWIAVAGLVIGLFFNVQFYLAAGWMSPSTLELNLFMFWAQVFLLYVHGYRLTTSSSIK